MALTVRTIPIGDDWNLGDPRKLFTALYNAIRDQVAEGVRFMSKYPPKLNPNWRRTGTLRRSWSFSVKSGGNRIEGEIKSAHNIAPYNERVQGIEQMEPWQSIGWRNVDDLLKQIDKDFLKRVDKELEKAFA